MKRTFMEINTREKLINALKNPLFPLLILRLKDSSMPLIAC